MSPRANGYLSLEPGLQSFARGEDLLTWAAEGTTAFAVGGVHASQDPEGLLAAFRAACAEAGYRRALVFPVGSQERETYHRAGFSTLLVGAEAAVCPTDFTLAGSRRADLRQMVNRGTMRHGIQVHETDAPSGSTLLGDLYQRWLLSRPAGHRFRLLVGTPRFLFPARRRYFYGQGSTYPGPCAFITLTPGWGGSGYGLDVMARAPDAPAGAMETLLWEVIRTLGSEGVEILSLGACPMAERTALPEGDPKLLRLLLRWIYRSRLTNRLFAFRSLTHFKQKFAPSWQPVHMACWPSVGVSTLAAGCRMWGIFGPATGPGPMPVRGLFRPDHTG